MLERTGARIPEDKESANEYREIGANISLSKNMMNNLVAYHQSIGADKDLPTDKQALFSYLNRFHLQVAVKNPHWPDDLPFGFVYGSFINAVMYGKVELHGFNIKAHVDAFRNWITQSGTEDQLYRSYYNANPDAMPDQLEGRGSSENEQVKADGYVDFPPHVVKKQIDTLERLHGTMGDAIASLTNGNAKSYRRRLENTKQKYIEEGNWPE